MRVTLASSLDMLVTRQRASHSLLMAVVSENVPRVLPQKMGCPSASPSGKTRAVDVCLKIDQRGRQMFLPITHVLFYNIDCISVLVPSASPSGKTCAVDVCLKLDQRGRQTFLHIKPLCISIIDSISVLVP